MYSANQMLFRLYYANQLFAAGSIQEIELGIIILDNAIEGWLYQAGRRAFWMDTVNYYHAPREYSKEYRLEYDRRFDRIISHAVKTKLLSSPDADLLKYAHSIRNNLYHKFHECSANIEIAKRIYIHILYRYANKWPNPSLFFTHSTEIGYESYDWANRSTKEISSFTGTGIAENWNIAFKQPDDEQALSELISKSISDRALEIHSSINDIRECIKEKLQWGALARYSYLCEDFDVYKRKPKRMPTIDYVLMAYNFLRNHRDELEDEASLVERRKLGKKLFQKIRNGKAGRYENLILFLKTKSDRFEKTYESATKAISALNQFNNQFGALEKDSNEASCDYHGHLQDLYERYKGK